jgi:hypothetical protein
MGRGLALSLQTHIRGWSQSGRLTLDFSNGVGGLVPQVVKPVTCQAVFPKDTSTMYTVQLSVTPPTGPKRLDGFFAAYAEVKWSVAGNFIRRVVSLNSGQSISGSGEGVKVTLFDATPLIDNSDQTGLLTYPCDILIVPGSRASNSTSPTNTPAISYQNGIAQNLSVTWPVPSDAGVISVRVDTALFTAAGNPEASNDMVVQQLDQINRILKQYRAADYPAFVPLHPACVNVAVYNLSADAGSLGSASIVFGIEG